jgi:GNAT superfamily N-acetyltransferase
MIEEVQFIILQKGEINRFRDKIIEFLSGLGEERKTLLANANESSEEKYLEGFNWVLDNTILACLARSKDRVVGLGGYKLPKKRLHIFGVHWPFVTGYAVVNRDFQGKGIGSKLVIKRLEYMRGKFAFLFGQTLRDNVPVRRIWEKFNYKKIYEDESFAYAIKPFRKELSLFVPLIGLSFRLYLKLKSISAIK